MTLRVVQWTTGNVGKQSAAAIVRNPGLELVGCYAWSPEKVGRDVGDLCGMSPIGVFATNDVGALLALRPDCVVYNPMWPSTDELVRILEAGVNVVKVPPGGVIGRHLHVKEIETVYVLAGQSVLTLGDADYPFVAGQVVAIPAGLEHALRNTGAETVELLCIFTPPLA